MRQYLFNVVIGLGISQGSVRDCLSCSVVKPKNWLPISQTLEDSKELEEHFKMTKLYHEMCTEVNAMHDEIKELKESIKKIAFTS